ncbi:hypothetical protein VOLCADRAFT_99770 [Volvox carteri f. nagariensis]|uniref:Peptidase M11 gametolysin domain-containing protein n=1 Tax=Volvox carteri f. nagariensis TaxID=3068 RepID=D8UIL6_VOLCA|nr:uncharacterized protein VOLCADRAFT_99770 [Volvox carteri f. nagariensis]EFJ40417.1 hypothetical protein VOLCADRAFT_99770 [Volvox carteri f. nagariensis]|eukprot:XP_002958497.1 hypothetical protein VOLCADRAFT_99770 [Volvox carteri f. nagariensis]
MAGRALLLAALLAGACLSVAGAVTNKSAVAINVTIHVQAGSAGGRTTSSRRRLLSEAHEQARRMVMDFHNTRRSVQAVQSLLSLFRAINITTLSSLVPKADNPIVVGKTADKDLFIVDGKQQRINSITFVFKSSSCGLNPSLDANKLRSWWFDRGNSAPIVATLQRYYNSCSYNQLIFQPEDNLVFDVDIPCAGSTSRGKYDLRTGNGNGVNADNELYGLVELAKQYVQPWGGPSASSARSRIQIRTDSTVAQAMVGCAQDQDCYTWINPGVADDRPDMPVVFQELGHNIGLLHSGRIACDQMGCQRDEYGDPADPMGSAWAMDPLKQIVCTNAPQSYKAGWSSPILGGHLNASDLKPGISRDFVIPSMLTTKMNMLRIVTDISSYSIDESSKPQRALYVSYRVRPSEAGGYDSGLNTNWNNRVWCVHTPSFHVTMHMLFLRLISGRLLRIHEYNDTANGNPGVSGRLPLVLAMLTDERNPPNIGSGWGRLSRSFSQLVPGLGGMTIRIKTRTPDNATVSVCRFLRQLEGDGPSSVTCDDGIDNDCDGLVDMDDPDCNTSQRFPPPTAAGAPARPPPPPQKASSRLTSASSGDSIAA